jgi:uroporphyrinogen-III synthase
MNQLLCRSLKFSHWRMIFRHLWMPHGRLSPEHCDLPIYTVGDATAAAAKQAGFEAVHSARGDSADLVVLLREALQSGGRIGYLAGIPRKDEALQALSGQFTLFTIETYGTLVIEMLPEEISFSLRQGQIDAVLHFSPRSAQVFADLIDKAQLFAEIDRVLHVFISPAAEISRFTRRMIAVQPNLAAMIAALGTP